MMMDNGYYVLIEDGEAHHVFENLYEAKKYVRRYIKRDKTIYGQVTWRGEWEEIEPNVWRDIYEEEDGDRWPIFIARVTILFPDFNFSAERIMDVVNWE